MVTQIIRRIINKEENGWEEERKRRIGKRSKKVHIGREVRAEKGGMDEGKKKTKGESKKEGKEEKT